MVFHWLKLYGKARARATSVATNVVDDVFTCAQAASPHVFAASSEKDAARKAKFEHMCPWLALKLMALPPAQVRAVTEAMLDRIEIGLREGGVSDMKIGPEVRKYAAALNGRVQRYQPFIQAGQWQELAVALTEHGVDAALSDVLHAHAVKKAA